MKSEVRIVINRHQDKYNDQGYDIELRASTTYKGEIFRVVRGGYAQAVDESKEKVIKALQSEINMALYLRKKAKAVDKVIGVTTETAEIEINY